MANIDIQQPAKISRNTAADGDFLWEKDFKVLYENDEKLKNAIQQASQDYTAGNGITIDPSTKTISVNAGTGIEATAQGLNVNIEGEEGVNVRLDGKTYKISAYDSETVINELNGNVADLQRALVNFQDEVEQTYVTSAGVTNPNKQYAYSKNGWVELADGHDTASFWRPSVSTAGDISWTLDEHGTSTPPATQNIKGAPGTNGTDGRTPTLKIGEDNKWYWKYTDESEWTPLDVSATGPRGATGETGPQGFSVELDSVETVPGGKEITLKWGDPASPSTSAFVIPSGDKGGKGDPGERGPNGYTPSVSAESFEDTIGIGQKYTFYWPAAAGIEDLVSKIYHGNTPTVISSPIPPDPTSEHPKGGSAYNIRTKINGTEYDHIINIWHGKDGDATTIEFDTATGHTMSGNGGDSYPYGVNTNVIATQNWVGQQGFITKDVNNLTNYYKKTETSAKEELTTEFAKKVDIPINLGDMYLVLRTNADGTVSGWSDLSDYCYSKSSAKNTFIQQSFIDNTLSGTGANAGNKLGVNTNAIPTKDWLDDNYLPLSGGTVSGKLTVSASDFYALEVKRGDQTSTGAIGINGAGGMSLKITDANNNNTQLNIAPNADMDKRFSIGDAPHQPVAYLIPATIEQNGWSPSTDDKILHIVLES